MSKGPGADGGPGALITFEGPEGGGKSTQIARLADRLRGLGATPFLTREPGGTPAGERIRGLLLDPGLGELLPVTEALLFSAARAELTAREIRPALAAGRVVLCDRFGDSTRAYQGYGRGLPLDRLDALLDLATGGLAPRLTLLLDLPTALGLERRRREGDWNRLDAADLAFHERVRAGYLALAAAEPARWRVIDASDGVARVSEAVWAAVTGALALPSA